MLIIDAVLVLWLAGLVIKRRPGDYLGRLVAAIVRATGRRLEQSRSIQFILAVEDVLLQFISGGGALARRIRALLWAGAGLAL
jgi:hypothetical protein